MPQAPLPTTFCVSGPQESPPGFARAGNQACRPYQLAGAQIIGMRIGGLSRGGKKPEPPW